MNSIPVLIIPVLNRYDLLDNLLESINYPIDNIFIINNGGTYKTDMPNIKVMNMPTNIGVASSWNLGIKCYPHDMHPIGHLWLLVQGLETIPCKKPRYIAIKT